MAGIGTAVAGTPVSVNHPEIRSWGGLLTFAGEGRLRFTGSSAEARGAGIDILVGPEGSIPFMIGDQVVVTVLYEDHLQGAARQMRAGVVNRVTPEFMNEMFPVLSQPGANPVTVGQSRDITFTVGFPALDGNPALSQRALRVGVADGSVGVFRVDNIVVTRLDDERSVALRALDALISDAIDLMIETIGSTTAGANVRPDQYWVTPAQFEAFVAAISAASSIRNNLDSTAAFLQGAITALQSAIDTLENQRASGTMAEGPAALSLLNERLGAASLLMSTTMSSANGNDIPPTAMWATPANLTLLSAAMSIASEAVAGGSGDANIQALRAATTSLNAAIELFESVRSYGTYNPLAIAMDLLNGRIAVANARLAETLVSDDGTDIPESDWWSTPAYRATFNAAIAAAVTARDYASATIESLNTARGVLDTAINQFVDTDRSLGTKTIIDFNLRTYTALQNLALNADATSALSGSAYVVPEGGSVKLTVGRQGGTNYLRITERDNQTDGIKILIGDLQADDRIFIRGRTLMDGANAQARIQLATYVGDAVVQESAISVNGVFEINYLVTAADVISETSAGGFVLRTNAAGMPVPIDILIYDIIIRPAALGAISTVVLPDFVNERPVVSGILPTGNSVNAYAGYTEYLVIDFGNFSVGTSSTVDIADRGGSVLLSAFSQFGTPANLNTTAARFVDGGRRVEIPIAANLLPDTQYGAEITGFRCVQTNLRMMNRAWGNVFRTGDVDEGNADVVVSVTAVLEAEAGGALDVAIAGQANNGAISTVVVRVQLNNATFRNMTANEDVSAWFEALPAGITATVVPETTGDSEYVLVTIAGTPTAATDGTVPIVAIIPEPATSHTGAITSTTSGTLTINITEA